MSRVVLLPPDEPRLADGTKAGGWWHETGEPGRVICDLCPRKCHLKPGDRGFCFVRENRDGRMVLSTYGRSTGFCVDPIEKKPLNHFLPGTSVLSFGTAGCNLGCKFCQNWDISKSREVARLSEEASPESIARAAVELGCRSVAFTYNDPVIWAEYAIDCAKACRAVGIKAVAVTAGYITPEARGPFYESMDAANVDLKAFTEDFYHRITYSHLEPVLDTLRWLKHESDVWFEITNLVIPDANDSMDEIRQMCDWILESIGDETPVHFTAFHPDFRMMDRPRTPHETLLAAHEVARAAGIKYPYVGNVDDTQHQSTYCPACGGLLIERNWYELGAYHMRGELCGHCGARIHGRFESSPGNWGRRRMPVRISDYTPTQPAQSVADRGRTMTRTESHHGSPSGVAPPPQLTDAQRRTVHRAACRLVAAEVLGQSFPLTDADLSGIEDLPVMGAFVTLKRRGRLRGCCGTLGKPTGLLDAVTAAAVRTAGQDIRLPAVSPSELEFLDLDVTLLYEFQPVQARGVDRIAAVTVGRHGVQVARGTSSGLLLPSVAVDNGWDAEELLRQVCRKAQLPTTAWKADDTQLTTFEGTSIGGPFQRDVLKGLACEAVSPIVGAELARLAEHGCANLVALLRGATPSYYLPDCPDGTVTGVAISLSVSGSDSPWQLGKLSLRPGIPLQATLFELTQRASQALAGRLDGADGAGDVAFALAVLYDPAMHGTVDDPDWNGVDPRCRAVMVMEAGKSAWVFDPGRRPAALLDVARREAEVSVPESANVISLAAVTTVQPMVVSSVPRPRSRSGVRPAAVSGTFYPGDPAELAEMVDEMLESATELPGRWAAAMVPHAGLRYSGRIAAGVWKSVQLARTILVIGPKHTRLGVACAVAPHDTWSLPGTTIGSDSALARRLAEGIEGLQLDSAAHEREHAIEVELPFIARRAPDARVVGLTIGGGDFARCRRFAVELAAVLRQMDEPPLLVISSDMNHFAPDAENRVLDELALTAMEQLDGEHLYETVTRHQISMCGVLPAVIVMETLRELGRLTECRRAGYATSGDVTGERDRVVGYAGMLFS